MSLDPGTADRPRSALATGAAIPVTPFGPDGQVDWAPSAGEENR